MTRCSVVLLLIAVAIAAFHAADAHVRLTWPPARFPDYDFLDNVRTGGPCGVPRPSNEVVTTFREGATINVTFHLAYPHRGGILVNILDSNGTIVHALLGTQWVNTNDSTRFYHEVQLPDNFTCEQCTLQLLRQAGEWTAPGGGYIFFSCSEISIVPAQDFMCTPSTCSNQGTCTNDGQCQCNRLYSGEFCQNKDECIDESDCNNQGSCIDIKAISYPKRQCFCNHGYFGDNCMRKSNLTDITIIPSLYTIKRRLNVNLTLHARIVGNEIEVALIHVGTGFVATGWRPSRGINRSCKREAPGNYPVGSNQWWPNEQTIPIFNSTSNTINNIILPLFDLNLRGTGGGPEENGGGAEENGGGAEENGGGAEENGGGAEENGGGAEENGGGTEENGGGAEENGGGAEENGGGTEENGGGAEENGGGAEENGGGAEENGGGAEENGGGAEENGGGAEENGGGTNENGGGANLHAMDCTDIVIAVARGKQFRVFDYYTRDRSTPRRDSFYDGQDSITAAIASEDNGVTTVKWRKPLKTGDLSADHDVENQIMSVIWAYGQIFPNYFHSPRSGIEANMVGNDRFYQPDEIKYHGNVNRGSTSINFFEADPILVDDQNCNGVYMSGCTQGNNCDYEARWQVSDDSVRFVVSAKQINPSQTEWVAIGFSLNLMMPMSDLVIGAANASGGGFVDDRYIDGYSPAPIDAVQNIGTPTIQFVDGLTTMTFTRPLKASDDRDLSLDQCVHFLYGWGGIADIDSGAIFKHPSTPIVSTDKICLQQCGFNGATRLATPINVLSLFVLLMATMMIFY